MCPRPDALLLRYASLVVEVSAGDPSDLAWLAEFLQPSFESMPIERRGEATHQVEFVVSAEGHAALQVLHASAGLEDLEGFSFDGSFSIHRGRLDEAGRLWIRDAKRGAFFGVTEDRKQVRVVVAATGPAQRIALMRVVRELGTVAMYEADRLPVHGAAFAVGAEAVVICGPKRAGKTSLLVHALSGGAAFLSNDRLFLDTGLDTGLDTDSGRPPSVRGMPTIVMLRNGTLERFAMLREGFERARFDRGRTLAECAPGVERPEPRAGAGFDRPGISPAQLCALFDVPLVASAPVRAVLMPELDGTVTGMRLERLDARVAQPALGRCLLKPSDPVRYSEVFSSQGGRVALPPEAERERCLRLAERVPTYRCRLGPDAYEHDLVALLARAERVTR